MIATALLGVSTAPAALGAPGSATADGAAGQRLTVSQSTELSPDGQKVSVSGSGYPTFKGVYVAVCKIPAKGERPTPCGGGADTTGASQTSQWVASNAPSYAKGLTVPYGKGGTFDVSIWAAPTLPDGEDCRNVPCAIVTRTDHTRTSDRSQDVLVPITFASGDSSGGGLSTLVVVAVVVGFVVLLAAVGVVLTRRRRALHAAAAEENAALVEAEPHGSTTPDPKPSNPSNPSDDA